MADSLICCFTGHRDILPEHSESMSAVLDTAVEKLISRGVRIFRAGGAIGFDTVAALRIIEKKKKYPFLELHLFLPCKDQSSLWNGFSQEIYEYVLRNADKVVYTSESFSRGCMLKRNRALVDGSQICLAYCLKDSGGTAYTVNYAQKKGVRVLNIAGII